MDTTENSTVPVWTGQWRPAAWEGLDAPAKLERRQWFANPTHKQVRTDTDDTLLRAHMGASQWAADGDGMMALRAAALRAGEGRADYALALAQALETGSLPIDVLDLWAEDWMLGKWVAGVVDHLRQPEHERLARALIEHWPWVFVQAGRGAHGQNQWRHPLLSLLKQERQDLAGTLIERIAPGDWMSAGEDYYQTRRWWRESRYWLKDDPTWVLRVAQAWPGLLTINADTGMGPLEQAARDHTPRVLEALHGLGLRSDPTRSFGLSLPHWAAFGVSEDRWDAQAGQAYPKTPEQLQKDIAAFGLLLRAMKELGIDVDAKVESVDTRGLKRARHMPKPKQDVRSYLQSRKFAPTTHALIDLAIMEAMTPLVNDYRKSRTLRL